MRLPFLFAALSCALFAACGGSEIATSTFSAETGGAGGASGGAGGTGGASSSSSSSSSSSASSSSSSSSASSSSGASSSSSSSSSSSGGACSYASPNVCDAALQLSPISGDTGSDLRTVSGTTAKWFKVHVTEDSNFSNGLSYTATLQPATGVDWDLYIYPGDATQTNCLASVSQATGVPESWSESWSDNLGTDDGRWFTLEVRYAGGTGCGAEAKWTLTVEGHKP